jgi:arylsulfatase A-like enzyme
MGKARRDVLKGGAGLAMTGLLPGGLFAAGSTTASPPNVIVIVADDLGFADLSCYGRRDYSTPNIDSLAADGIKLTQGYSNSAVCSATRVALMTGRYQYRLAAGLNEPLGFSSDLGLPPSHPTMPSLFRDGGYDTILIGKWHLGPPPKYGPLMSGYERFYGIYGGASDYFKHGQGATASRYGVLIDQDEPANDEGYMTDLLGSGAIREIERSVDRGKSFFMSLHFTAPHWPWEGPGDSDVSDTITDPVDRERGSIAVYAEMMKSLDGNVGRVLKALERLGIADNTIVVFTSDNGGERFSDTWPLTGNKTELLEGGIRVPLLVRWPAKITAGLVSSQTMLSMDLLPTLLGAAGLPSDPGFPPDGENLLPQLMGAAPRSRRLFWRYKAQEQRAYRDGNWKYLLINGNEHLFDLSNDERERANRKKLEPERFERMKREFEAWDATMLPYTEANSSHNIKKDNWADRY